MVWLRSETPLILMVQPPKTNSAVQQLFNKSRPLPSVIEPQLVAFETHRASDAVVRLKAEEAAVRRVTERNAQRCSLLRSEMRKKQQPKQDTTSLAERIRLLTCDVEDEMEEQRSSPAGASIEKFCTNAVKKFTANKNNEKIFGNVLSSSLSPDVTAPQQPPDHGDVYEEPQKPRSESRRQFLSTLAPLAACVGSAAHRDAFYYVPPGDKKSTSSASNLDQKQRNDTPAPDVVAGTPGAMEGNDGLTAFAKETARRTERLRQRYSQELVSSDDEQDDYGFHRRPPVRGIAVKQQLGSSNGILEHMQNDLQSSPSAAQLPRTQTCQHSSSNYSWPYYSEANLNSWPQSRACTSASCCADSSQELDSSQTSSEQTSPVRSARGRRPESPPPIRNNHHLFYVPYASQYHYQHIYNAPWTTEHIRMRSVHYQQQHQQQQMQQQQMQQKQQIQERKFQHQQQSRCGPSTPQPISQVQLQAERPHFLHALKKQNICPVPVRYRTVPAPQLGGGKKMISYSEKVVPPLCQQAPGSPSRTAREAPEGAPASISATAVSSPMVPSNHPLYYAMNV